MCFDVVNTNYNIIILENGTENNAVFIGNQIDRELLIQDLDKMKKLKQEI